MVEGNERFSTNPETGAVRGDQSEGFLVAGDTLVYRRLISCAGVGNKAEI
jgi:hypothetical protein